ncbi:MAG TPA: 16S rRNA (guanine(527)-N(7))-methyltransferase RsmG [Thermoleophilia bacterium]|nr:16S rRNA (guanine(527)-N(7))-methyltransferase RsmG [Thermoleophilia bacterium]
MQFRLTEAFRTLGLSSYALNQLSEFGDLLLGSKTNVSGLRTAEEIEELHFLDSLSLLRLQVVRDAHEVVDVGSGGGLPSVVLAIAQPNTRVIALDSVGKKCRFVEFAASKLGLGNLQVICERAEELGRGEGRERFDVATSRALAALPVVAELTLPLVKMGGHMVAMKGALSDQERIDGEFALAILGGGQLEELQIVPFPGADNRWLHVAQKESATSARYPRRVGVPAKQPLNAHEAVSGGS